MGLTAGAVPARVDAPAKEGLLDPVEDARSEGFSGRWACRVLGVDHARVLGWQARAAAGGDLADAAPGPVPGEALHALLDWERTAIVQRPRTGAGWTCRTASWPTAAPGWGGCSSRSPACCGS